MWAPIELRMAASSGSYWRTHLGHSSAWTYAVFYTENEMIRVGHKPKIVFIEAHNDMGHFFPSEYAVGDWFYMTDQMYVNMLSFCDLDLMKEPVKGSLDEIMGLKKTKIEWAINLNPSKSLLWQFNTPERNLKGFVRQVIVFGGPPFECISLFQAYIVFPIYRTVAKILNKILYFKRLKEWKTWHAWRSK